MLSVPEYVVQLTVTQAKSYTRLAQGAIVAVPTIDWSVLGDIVTVAVEP